MEREGEKGGERGGREGEKEGEREEREGGRERRREREREEEMQCSNEGQILPFGLRPKIYFQSSAEDEGSAEGKTSADYVFFGQD